MSVSGFRFGKGKIADNGYSGEFLYIGTSLNTETEEIQDVNNPCRNTESKCERNHVD